MTSEWKSLKVLFLTDDRQNYRLGNYYLAYQRAFTSQTDITLAHPLEPLPDPARFDLVVFGHASIENFARIRGSRFIPRAVLARQWPRYSFLRAIRRCKTPSIVFTKNDYKDQDIKDGFIQWVRPRIAVIQHRSIIPQYRSPEGGTLQWVPFGVDTEMFTPAMQPPEKRPLTVGFRASSNEQWTESDLRSRFYQSLGKLDARYKTSLSLGSGGSNFLLGQDYVDWVKSCALLGNTHSALGAVGPKFLEALACDTVPLAPVHEYEDLLRPHEHYVPVTAVANEFPDLEANIERYLTDRAYQQQLRHHGRELVREHTVYAQTKRLLGDVEAAR
jgi:hypothetical protein